MVRFILLALASVILACDAKFHTGLSACPGFENHPFQFISGSIPEVFTFPGTAAISYESKRTIDLPTDLIMKFELKMVAPLAFDVPCEYGGLSCEHEVCKSDYFTKEVCGQFPTWQQCGCPLRAGGYNLKVNYPLPDLGKLGSILAGDYEGRALYYSKANPDNILGCVNMAFSIAAGKAKDEL